MCQLIHEKGHISPEQQQQNQQNQQNMRGSTMGSFSVIVPIYLGAIFVFFLYIVAKVIIIIWCPKSTVELTISPRVFIEHLKHTHFFT